MLSIAIPFWGSQFILKPFHSPMTFLTRTSAFAHKNQSRLLSLTISWSYFWVNSEFNDLRFLIYYFRHFFPELFSTVYNIALTPLCPPIVFHLPLHVYTSNFNVRFLMYTLFMCLICPCWSHITCGCFKYMYQKSVCILHEMLVLRVQPFSFIFM